MKLNPGNHTQVLHQLAAEITGIACFNAPLAEHNSWQIGGPADLLLEPDSPQQVAKVVHFARARQIPVVVIGQGLTCCLMMQACAALC